MYNLSCVIYCIGSQQLEYMQTTSLGRRDELIPAQVIPFRGGLDVVTSDEISPSRRSNDAVGLCIFLANIYLERQKSTCAVKRIWESARWAYLTIRLVVEASSMSARKAGLCMYLRQKIAIRYSKSVYFSALWENTAFFLKWTPYSLSSGFPPGLFERGVQKGWGSSPRRKKNSEF